MIQMYGVRKEYRMGDNVVTALDGVDISIRPHEFVSIIGPSGSGKSTLMNIIGCLDMADEGTYLFDGQEINDYTEDELAVIRNKKIGFVFQQFNLLSKMSAQENVELPLVYQGMSAGKRHRMSEEVLDRVGLLDRMDHKPTELSGGQQQRVAIARALMTDPELLLLDEITSALDPMLVGEVLNMVAELKAQGTTILMATHEMSFAHEAADRIVLLRHGVIAENGTPAEVMDESQDPETIEFFSHFRH